MIRATICYLRENGSTLMIDRSSKKDDYQKNVWNAPGGKHHEGESDLECVARETREETGLTPIDPIQRGAMTYHNPDGKEWLVLLYTAERHAGTLRAGKEGVPVWVKNEELGRLKLWAGDYLTLPFLERAIADGGSFTGEVWYTPTRDVERATFIYRRKNP